MQNGGVSVASQDYPQVPIGTVFSDRYRVIERIGGGGMGHVYLAEETRLERRCALKVLHPAMAKERHHVERFLREAQLMARLSHPNIVNIYSFGEEPAGVYFAMELLDGEDLHARLRGSDERPCTITDCVTWAVEIVRAMSVVHKAGLIHRDLKASNIFLARQDGQEVVKLLDFGIARPIEGSDLTKTGVALGTPSYMSPEQINNLPLDHTTDIYSFGVLLFKMLTGRMPFIGSPLEVTTMHCSAPVPRPSAIARDAGISRELDEIVLKAMAKQPKDRFKSMEAVERALFEVLSEEQPTVAFALKNVAARSTGAAEMTGEMTAGDFLAARPDGQVERRTQAPWLMLTAVTIIVVIAVAIAVLR